MKYHESAIMATPPLHSVYAKFKTLKGTAPKEIKPTLLSSVSSPKQAKINIRPIENKIRISMVLILDGNSEHVAHECRKFAVSEKNRISDFLRINQLP